MSARQPSSEWRSNFCPRTVDPEEFRSGTTSSVLCLLELEAFVQDREWSRCTARASTTLRCALAQHVWPEKRQRNKKSLRESGNLSTVNQQTDGVANHHTSKCGKAHHTAEKVNRYRKRSAEDSTTLKARERPKPRGETQPRISSARRA